ncbi:hypothetical protein XBFM1_1260112 [Xenorhabdus bovienii str. feltiae Moldova]|uniref:Uncharacterized protein n=1 Tax=Xenorhabdus bovienii str. feltiae Moldova TaxID=1398200 RepID=A0A077NNG1_XENBV|nr:hypothetical protein XBFM1_1260112 [Xenorhabdus bovienii str. feltiae Moldova]
MKSFTISILEVYFSLTAQLQVLTAI